MDSWVWQKSMMILVHLSRKSEGFELAFYNELQFMKILGRLFRKGCKIQISISLLTVVHDDIDVFIQERVKGSNKSNWKESKHEMMQRTKKTQI